MNSFKRVVAILAFLVPAWAGDFDGVINAAMKAWPERTTVVVVCNKDASAMALMDLGSATEKKVSLFVVDLTSARNLDKMLTPISRKPRNEVFLLLLSDDPVAGETSEAGRTLVGRMTSRGIPVVGTTAASLKLGAVFALGSGTGDKLLTNPEMAKKLGVALPDAP